MINSYIILNRKTSIIIKTFIVNIIILIVFVIWWINTLYYQTFIHSHSKLLYFETNYYLEVLIPVKEVKQIMKQNQIIIDSVKYNYEIYKIGDNVEYKNNINYQYIYLKILNLDEEYLVNGYEIDIKIPKEKKKIIDYLKE